MMCVCRLFKKKKKRESEEKTEVDGNVLCKELLAIKSIELMTWNYFHEE